MDSGMTLSLSGQEWHRPEMMHSENGDLQPNLMIND